MMMQDIHWNWWGVFAPMIAATALFTIGLLKTCVLSTKAFSDLALRLEKSMFKRVFKVYERHDAELALVIVCLGVGFLFMWFCFLAAKANRTCPFPCS